MIFYLLSIGGVKLREIWKPYLELSDLLIIEIVSPCLIEKVFSSRVYIFMVIYILKAQVILSYIIIFRIMEGKDGKKKRKRNTGRYVQVCQFSVKLTINLLCIILVYFYNEKKIVLYVIIGSLGALCNCQGFWSEGLL